MQKKVLKMLGETILSQKLKFQTSETKEMAKIKNRKLSRSLHQMRGTVMKKTNKQTNLQLKVLINNLNVSDFNFKVYNDFFEKL